MKRAAIVLAVVMLSTAVVYSLTGGVAVSGTIPLNAGDNGPRVDVTFSTESELDLQDAIPDSQTVVVRVDNGNVTFTASGPTNATIAEGDVGGEWTNITGLDVTAADLTINPGGKEPAGAGGGVTELAFRDPALNDSQVDFVYSSAGTVTVHGLPPDTTVVATTESGEAMGANTTSAAGVGTFDVTAGTDKRVLLSTGIAVRDQDTGELIENSTVDFYFDDQVIRVDAPSGIASSSGLPSGDYLAEGRADGYYTRSIYSTSSTIYLLNESAQAVQPVFTLIDFTGEFGGDRTILIIEHAIDEQWQTVEADYFGAGDEVAAQLSKDERHRLTIINTDTGDERLLGIYTSSINGTVELVIEADDTIIRADDRPAFNYDPNLGSLPAEETTVAVELDSKDTSFESYEVRAVLDGTELFSASGSDPDGETFEPTFNLTGEAGNRLTIWVNWTATNGSDNVSKIYSIRESFENQNLIDMLLSIPSSTSSGFTAFIALIVVALMTAFAATTTSSTNAAVVGLAFFAGFMLLGWVPVSWVIVATIGLFAIVAIRRAV